MSGKGDCSDNALMESFFGILKNGCIDRQFYQSRAQARHSIFEYLEAFSNRQRLHPSLGEVSPATAESSLKPGVKLVLLASAHHDKKLLRQVIGDLDRWFLKDEGQHLLLLLGQTRSISLE
jgi:Integrase core domain